VVEHDEMMMREAQHIIDMGPLASHLWRGSGGSSEIMMPS
jgi:excinuclease UvrABC ATPase subunit